LAAAKHQVETGGLAVLVDDHVAAPLAAAEGIRPSVVEEAVTAHDLAVPKHDDSGRATLLGAGHVDDEAVEAVDDPRLGVRRVVWSCDLVHEPFPATSRQSMANGDA